MFTQLELDVPKGNSNSTGIIRTKEDFKKIQTKEKKCAHSPKSSLDKFIALLIDNTFSNPDSVFKFVKRHLVIHENNFTLIFTELSLNEEKKN